jgi:hypothetical protein
LPGPGQQRAEFVGFGPTRFNVYRDIAEIGERLYVIELGRLDQRNDDRPAVGPAIGAGEEVVLGAELDRPARALDVFESIRSGRARRCGPTSGEPSRPIR